MSSTNQTSHLVVAPNAAAEISVAHDEKMTEKTAAELRQLCEDKGEAFDTSLTEAQAQQRI